MVPSLTPTLMVVGDDASFRYLIHRYAKKSAYHAVLVHFAEDVLSIARRELPIAVLLEFDLPGERGRQALQALTTHPDTCEIPVVVCSWTDEAERSLDEGAAVYLRKPILYDDFQTALVAVEGWQQH